MFLRLVATAAALLCLLRVNNALENGLGIVPPMGWNSWNAFHCDVDELKVKLAVEVMLGNGLVQLGYNYMNLDDCWMSPNRTSDGRYQADPDKFPSGIPALVKEVHKAGMKFGLYTSAGTKTCQKLPGSLDNEEIDAETFAAWGVDYLKYDNCYGNGIPSIDRYPKMRNALNATGRDIFFSLCQWGVEDSWQWAPAVGNTWRTTGDIQPNWRSIRSNFWESQKHIHRAGKGSWLDPDMLEVGNGALTTVESRSHFSLWCLAKAPLLLGMDLDQSLTDGVLNIITNTNLIQINQDPTSPPARCFQGNCTGTADDWSVFVTTSQESTIVMIINWSDDTLALPSMMGQTWGVVPTLDEEVLVVDLWTNENLGTFDFEELKKVPIPTLVSHDCRVYQLKTVPKTKKKIPSLTKAISID
eukprot:CAMPEP_0194212912 /NCGR_PEP_ID=MMETSP0156-20130528/13084_1 /TAXON_ID=33649 /ORGANISM="Thalassionema nitzschioides, Strain L26-B" /LENGTH=413 /DNA_ID=CAMNT_0038940817 /DNA_START=94 /DNA_END=1335 /DNA_ORIENTATION=+